MAYIDRRKNRSNKIITKLSLSIITNLLYYSLTINDLVTISNLANLLRLVQSIDIERSYSEDSDLPTIEHLRLLIEILEMNINYTMDDFDELRDYIKDKTNETYISRATIDNIFNNCEQHQFDENKILYWNKFIQNQLDYNSIYKDIGVLKEIVSAFEHPDPDTMSKLIPTAKNTLIELNKTFNVNKMSVEDKMNSFNITDRNSARNIIRQSLESIYNPGNRIPSGYKLFNRMIGGGYQGSRVYAILGPSKGFKSGFLLNEALNVTTDYCDYQLKDPSKTPAVLYFTMENSMMETFERIYHYLGLNFDFEYTVTTNKKGREIKKYNISDEDVDKILDTIEEETINKTGIALRIEFRTHMSVDTGELDRLYENYSLIDNQEIIFIVQDYIKRIHSQRSYKSEQKREELGEVINEFGNFAKMRNIPILTASQLNREALKVIESAKSNNKKDIGRKLGGSQIGESSLIYENADYTIITYREYNKDEDCYYQTFNLIMARGESHIDYFAQPYDKNPRYHNFRIAKDNDLSKPLGVERISDTLTKEEMTAIENNRPILRRQTNSPLIVPAMNMAELKNSGTAVEIDENDRASEFI